MRGCVTEGVQIEMCASMCVVTVVPAGLPAPAARRCPARPRGSVPGSAGFAYTGCSLQ